MYLTEVEWFGSQLNQEKRERFSVAELLDHILH